jgi:hypothetical protein
MVGSVCVALGARSGARANAGGAENRAGVRACAVRMEVDLSHLNVS